MLINSLLVEKASDSSINKINQGICGCVMGGSGVSFLNFRLNFLRKLLSELDAPLIVRVYVPDDSLDEDFMFVRGDQLAKSEWIQLGKENRVCWSISLKEIRPVFARHV